MTSRISDRSSAQITQDFSKKRSNNDEKSSFNGFESDSNPLFDHIRSRGRQTEETTEERPKKKHKISPLLEDEMPSFLKRLSPGIKELPRHDALIIGSDASNQHRQKMVDKIGGEVKEKFEKAIRERLNHDPNHIRIKQDHLIEAKKVQEFNEKMGSQLTQLFYTLEYQKLTNKPQGACIINFARQIIRTVYDESTPIEEDESVEIPDDFKSVAEKYFEKLSLNINDIPPNMLAKAYKAATTKAETGEEEESSNIEETDQAMRQLGFLLLVTQHSPSQAVECIESQSYEEAISSLTTAATRIFEQASKRIEEHKIAHRNTLIQSSDEATFEKIALELANLILLDSGFINFGIIDSAADALIPNDFKQTTAVANLWIVLEYLAINTFLWERISMASPPKTKDSPSNEAIRVFFELNDKEKITHRHAQLFILSSLLSHLRQTFTGTCFATACMIKGLYDHPSEMVPDLVELVEYGYVTRELVGERRVFPTHARMSREYLDVEITVDDEGRILSSKRYRDTPDNAHMWGQPKAGATISKSPGIIAACRSLGIIHIESTLRDVLKTLPNSFVINDLLKALANKVYQDQEDIHFWFKSEARPSEEEYLKKAQFAFGVQTDHPLHRLYEQVVTSIPIYFGSQYVMPAWVFSVMEDILKKKVKSLPQNLQKKYFRLLREIHLPLISRMRYRYNHNIGHSKVLFEDGNHDVSETYWFGYQLCDTGLPKDFKYSTDLYYRYNNKSYYLKPNRFDGYPPPLEWDLVETETKFRDFLTDIVTETTIHLTAQSESKEEKEKWAEVAKAMCSHIYHPSFTKKMIHLIFGKQSKQKRDYEKNEHAMHTTPWQYLWGGDFGYVLDAYFGFTKSPSLLKKYNGTPKEVLAKCINFIKGHPEKIKEDYDNPRNQIVVASPVHVFLLKPSEESFMQAWQSECDTNEYIDVNVLQPGLEVSNSRFNLRQRKEIIDFVAENRWYSRYEEHEDWVRQQLTDFSKQTFDKLIREAPEIKEMSVNEFQEIIAKIVCTSRASDLNIGKRNRPWESKFKIRLDHLVKKLVPDEDQRDQMITEEVANQIIDFARNRKDTVALTEDASRTFRDLIENVPPGLSVKEFREKVMDAAYQARCESICDKDSAWQETLGPHLDTKLFMLLSEDEKEKLIESGIVTHDTNWKDEIHDVCFIFLVNPGTGKIELARYTPDTDFLKFMSQSSWFPKKLNDHGYWRFPELYRSWAGGPLFPVKEYFDLPHLT